MINDKKWTVAVEEDDGELILPLPSDMLDEMGWAIDDTIEWVDNEDGTWTIHKTLSPGNPLDSEYSVIKKAKMETVELDLSKDELYQLMLMAHENDITLNKMAERILLEYIEKYKNEKEE